MENNLYLFEIDSFKDWVDMFHEIDQDWTLPKDERPDYMLPTKYDTLEEMIEDHLSHGEDEYRIDLIMESIKRGLGSYASQFIWKWREQDGTDFISISFLTQ